MPGVSISSGSEAINHAEIQQDSSVWTSGIIRQKDQENVQSQPAARMGSKKYSF